jgi:hypothetical protein
MSTSLYRVRGSASYRDQVDASGEAEGAASDLFAELTGVEQEVPRHLRPIVIRKCRYGLAASIAAHNRLETASLSRLVWGPPARWRDLTTAADRKRQRTARATRKRKLLAVRRRLEQQPGTLIKRRDLAPMLLMGERTLDAAVAARALQGVRLGHEKAFPAAEVVQFIHRLVA